MIRDSNPDCRIIRQSGLESRITWLKFWHWRRSLRSLGIVLFCSVIVATNFLNKVVVPLTVGKGAISVAFVRPSVRPSVSYIANNSRTQRPSVPKFGRKVSHLGCDSHTSFKIERSKFTVRGWRGHTVHTVSAEPGGHTACSMLFSGTLVYVVGGLQSPSAACLRSVECFDVVAGEYFDGIRDYPYRVAGLGCCPILRVAGP